MNFNFYRPKEVNIPEFSAIVEKLRADLHELETKPCDKQTVCSYVKDLVKHAEHLPHQPQMVFWGLSDPNTMPHDARVDFFYLPTYLATAFMMKSALLYSELMNGDEETNAIKRVLKSGMLACTGRNFDGAGVLPLADCVKIFADAGAAAFLETYPSFCPEFERLFTEKKAMVDRGERPIREEWYMG